MTSAICTLYEGHYHHGLAALANSVYRHGFRGTLWIGYRGSLPPWARGVAEREGTACFEAAEGLTLRFRKVDTKRHLTNYKAEFMATLRSQHLPATERVFYFDPDIIVKSDWKFFDQWADGGVALCEDVNSPMHSTHPVRKMWSQFYAPHGFDLARNLDVYVNGGFLGISPHNWEFVELWRRLMDLMDAGGDVLSHLGISDRSYIFHKPDQDGLNITAMYSKCPVSIVGKEEMDLLPGGFLMSHALGTPKPWGKAFIREALKGYPPTQADRSFWQNTTSPIDLFPSGFRRWKKLDMRIGCAFGRFYARR